jgi:hypothetical protein
MVEENAEVYCLDNDVRRWCATKRQVDRGPRHFYCFVACKSRDLPCKLAGSAKESHSRCCERRRFLWHYAREFRVIGIGGIKDCRRSQSGQSRGRPPAPVRHL